MKKIMSFLIVMAVVFGLWQGAANATLILRGQDTKGNNLIYDDDLNITWYDFSNVADTWQNQRNWAAGLSIDFDGTIYEDWRLPTTVDGEWEFGFDGSTTGGYNITTSEMGHLYYTELVNLGWQATDGTEAQPGWGLANTGDFQNLSANIYWSGTDFPSSTSGAWDFGFNRGLQFINLKNGKFLALAVRSGDVTVSDIGDTEPIPEPATVALMGIGIVGLVGAGYRKRRKNKQAEKC
ncbi:MAG: PEP-CTERM sorting domain-containing protein [Candidatus Anammoxibacter sp.]